MAIEISSNGGYGESVRLNGAVSAQLIQPSSLPDDRAKAREELRCGAEFFDELATSSQLDSASCAPDKLPV